MSDDSVELAKSQDGGFEPLIPKQPEEREFGIGSDLPFSTPYSGPQSDETRIYEVLRPWGDDAGPSVSQLEAMRRCDGQARALYRLMTQPIRTALKTAKIINPDTEEDSELEETSFISDMLFLPPTNGGMEIPFKKVIAQMLSGVFDGFAPFELVYWQPDRGPLKGKYTLKKAAYRPAHSVTFLTDNKGNMEGIRQRIVIHGEQVDVKIDGANVIYYAANEEEREFYGVSYFQTAFYHYDKKAKLYYLAHLAAQRAAVGTRVGHMPEDAGKVDKAKFISALADLGVAQYIALPGEKWTVDVMQDKSTFDFLSYIDHHNSQMSKSVLANFFDASTGSTGSSSTTKIQYEGVGNTKSSMSDAFMNILKSIMDDIADIINYELIPRFIDWNFGSGKYPQFVWGEFTDSQDDAIRATFDKLAANADKVTPEFMRELEKHMASQMKLEIDYDAVAAREAQEKAALQAQVTAQAAGTAAPGAATPKPGEPAPGQDVQPADSLDSMVSKAKAAMAKTGTVGLSESENLLVALANMILDESDDDS